YERVGKIKYEQSSKFGTGRIMTRWLRKDGKIIDVLLNSTPIDKNDLASGVTYTVLDVTEEKQTQEALQASQKMLRSILDTIPVRVFWKDLNSVYIGSNLLFARDAGFISPEEIIGKKDIHMAWRSDVKKYNEIDRQVIETGKAKMIFEDPRIMPDGNIRWFKTSKIPLKDQNGDIFGILGCYEDITEHKKVVEALKENEARYRSLFENSPLSLWEVDFSKVKKIFDNLIANGVTDLDEYLEEQPEILKLCLQEILVLNVNQATMNIYKSQDKNELFTNLENLFSEEAFVLFRKELVAFTRGKTKCIDETVQYNLKGEIIWSEVHLIIAPGYEKTWEKVFVSVIDITERKFVEKALRESEHKYRLFFENAHDGIIIMKNDEFLDCNPKILEIFKCRKDQIIGNKPYNLSPPVQPDGKSSKEKALAHIKAVQSGNSQVYEWVYTRPDNGEFTAEVSLTPFVLENQNLILAIIRDITDRIQAEKTLRLMQFSIDHAGDAAYLLGQDAHFIYVNEEACRFLGYTKEELLGMTVFDIDPSFNLRRWRPHWKEIVKRKSFTIETVHKKKNGELLPVEITVNFVAFMGKKYNWAFGRDISERKRTEKALRESEKKYRTLFETMKQGVIYQNDKGEIISSNPAAETILGLSREQLYGLTSNTANWEAIHEDGSEFPGDTHPAMVALKTGKEIKNVVMGIFNPKDNAYRWININATPQFGETKKPFLVYSTFEDITERKLTEDKLRNYAETQQVLLREVNHRVKNNLATIISMLHKEEDRAASKGYANHLPVLQNLENRVNGLLTVHSILASINWQPVELSQLCEKVISNT
ncbi:MAG TPA: PAS domain S-box protein, partial [Caldithrix sp.]|nr:PAS domain S-box protein [Caldithrix sp.]